MELEMRLIADEVCRMLEKKMGDINIDTKKILEIKSLKILKAVQKIINNEKLSDFEMIEEIICLFEKNKIDCGGCHDF